MDLGEDKVYVAASGLKVVNKEAVNKEARCVLFFFLSSAVLYQLLRSGRALEAAVVVQQRSNQ
jgi:hypothetical protein